MDYTAIIHAVVDPIVEHPDAILIRELPKEEGNDKEVTILICAEKGDTSRLIGRKGVIANSIREIVSVAGKSESKRIHLRFESFDGEED